MPLLMGHCIETTYVIEMDRKLTGASGLVAVVRTVPETITTEVP